VVHTPHLSGLQILRDDGGDAIGPRGAAAEHSLAMLLLPP
jgi:hypothetical protein